MKAVLYTALLLAAIAAPASAQIYTGTARAIDGDSIAMTGIEIRLLGIDAVEAKQNCTRDGVEWACGLEAHSRLAALVDRKHIRCTQTGTDAYLRIVASCMVDRTDPAQQVVASGYAIALPKFSDAYLADEANARTQRLGIWAGEFEHPADWRAAHPQLAPKPELVQRAIAPAPAANRLTAAPGTHFRYCREAWAAGVAPLRRGDPGYRPGLDGDNDGVACEPYRPRRR